MQAVRFRVYAYDKDGGLLGEINNSQKYQLKWSCHVANKKAAYYDFSGEHVLQNERGRTLIFERRVIPRA